MKQAGITSTDIARALGVSLSTITRWMNGERQPKGWREELERGFELALRVKREERLARERVLKGERVGATQSGVSAS